MKLFDFVKNIIIVYGWLGFLLILKQRIHVKIFGEYPTARRLLIDLQNKTGLEIGGPSKIFETNNLVPLYAFANKLDNCDFKSNTIWTSWCNYKYDVPTKKLKYTTEKTYRKQYYAEATDLNMIPNEEYDFVASSHVIEHIANPLKALLEWKRILRKDGILILVVPHKDGTFDRKRPVATLEHLVYDLKKNTKEDDLSHLDEIHKSHDFMLDPAPDQYWARVKINMETRYLHHHVFNTELVVKTIDLLKMQVLSIDLLLPYNIVIISKKMSNENRIDNKCYLSGKCYKWRTPFPSDIFTKPNSCFIEP